MSAKLNSTDALALLEKAWKLRAKLNLFEGRTTLGVFYGPGEGRGVLSDLKVDRFGEHYWVTAWGPEALSQEVCGWLSEFYQARGAMSLVGVYRDKEGAKEEARVLWGEPPQEGFTVREEGLRFEIRFRGVKHPGLFLDHAPLRQWLRNHAGGWNVLNAFAYTGSLSIAAGIAGASRVVTLDLSKSTLQWAQRNWEINDLLPETGDFIYGDVFEWFPRLYKKGELFDCVILDPPSFSRGPKGVFSTAKDLGRLHALAMDLVSPTGVLLSSINSENISWDQYEKAVLGAAQEKKMSFQIMKSIDLPESCPTRLGDEQGRYLKGWILKRF